VWVAMGVQFGDFKSYVAAGQGVIDGRSLYEPGVATLPTIGGTFKYTPFAGLLFTLLAWLPTEVLVLGVNLFALLAVIWTGWRMLGYARDHGTFATTVSVGALSLGLQPVMWNMTWGDVNLVLMAIVFLDLSRPDGARFKGIGVGLAAGIKLVPGIFILYLLLTKRFRAAAMSVAAFVVTVGIGFLVLPSHSRIFWSGGVADADRDHRRGHGERAGEPVDPRRDRQDLRRPRLGHDLVLASCAWYGRQQNVGHEDQVLGQPTV
jgi:alpha-1,2-mannosyltransferase